MDPADTDPYRFRQPSLGRLWVLLQNAKHAKMRVFLQLGAFAGHFVIFSGYRTRTSGGAPCWMQR